MKAYAFGLVGATAASWVGGWFIDTVSIAVAAVCGAGIVLKDRHKVR